MPEQMKSNELNRALAALLLSHFPELGTDEPMVGADTVAELANLYAQLRDGEGDTEERESLRSNDGFSDMVVREAEAMILHAPIDDLVVFAYGSWAAARAAWGMKQGSRFRRPRPGRRAVA